MDLHDVEPDEALIRNLVYRAVFALDSTWPGIESIFDVGATVDEALALVGTLQSVREGMTEAES